MKTILNKLLKITLVMVLILFCQNIMAQQIKLVSGRIIDKESKKPFKNEAVFIYAFHTVADAEDAKKKIDSQNAMVTSDGETVADAGGYYEIKVAESGALIFKVGVASCVLEKVNYRMEINANIDAGIILEPVTITGTLQDIAPKEAAPTLVGNNLMMRNVFPIPAQFGKENSRMIIQPYVVECSKFDTIAYLRPIIYDGEQYQMTQERRMGYNLDNDPLNKYVSNKVLTSERMNVEWEDTLKVPDPTLSYFGNAVIQFEDYNEVYYSKLSKIISCEARRPLKFLEYEADEYQLDFKKYIRKAKRELRNTAANISLTFLVNKAEIDNKDPNNEIQLNNLRDNLLNIINCEDCKLKSIVVTGVSSPEGNYESNYSLAKRRAVFARQKLHQLLPPGALTRTFTPSPEAQVAKWEELLPYLEADSCFDAIKDLKVIFEKYPKDQNKQYSEIRKLPYYNTTIKEHLTHLRYMRFEYKHEIYRELTPEEILERYETDQDYHNGKKEFALYEYWHLFQLVKDPKELEALYKRAYKASAEIEGQPWILPANLLATSYLKRDTVDTSILEPFIDRKTRGANVVRTRIDGITKEIINPEEVVSNQLNMYLKANNYEQASIMAQILPNTPKNEKLKAFAMCLGGYYKGGRNAQERAEAKKTFEIVKSSTPLNEVIMCLAMDSKGYDIMALKAAKKLPQDDPKTWYLKAVAHNRNGEMGLMNAVYCLTKCWSLDKKYIPIAETDGDIGKDLFEQTEADFELNLDMIDIYIQQFQL